MIFILEFMTKLLSVYYKIFTQLLRVCYIFTGGRIRVPCPVIAHVKEGIMFQLTNKKEGAPFETPSCKSFFCQNLNPSET